MKEKRRIDIVAMLREAGSMVSVAQLAEVFHVAEMTIRRDLDALEKMNMVTRFHGGATLPDKVSDIYPIAARKQKHISEKQRIAKRALDMIEDGDTVFLDAGTTVLELAKILDKEVVVITNDALIAQELMGHEKVTLYCTGGLLDRSNKSYIYMGEHAERFISHYHTQKCFIGCSALSLDYGLMVFSGPEAEIKRKIVQASEKLICLADSSKINEKALTAFLPLKNLHVCITDSGITPEHAQQLREKGVQLEIASESPEI